MVDEGAAVIAAVAAAAKVAIGTVANLHQRIDPGNLQTMGWTL